uniref:Beta-1,3-galactosyl-O-glycosyl-glycoprotein beta-1,6-N-acetylglucosaminyltransferase 3 n=1 Tax=Crocodylus porosus TaxID=8502 RepID=A0A7M4FXS4_CROPO
MTGSDSLGIATCCSGDLLMLLSITVRKFTVWECSFQVWGITILQYKSQCKRIKPNQRLKLSPTRKITCSQIIRGDMEAISFLRSHWTEDVVHFPPPHHATYFIVIHNKIEMCERLFPALYTPQKLCLHGIALCFPNVFLASKLKWVVHASWSMLQANINSMEDLLLHLVPWQFLLNTCSFDSAIKINSKILQALKLLKVENSLEPEKPSEAKKFHRSKFPYEAGDSITQTNTLESPPTYGTCIFVSSAYVVQLLEWSKDMYSPGEHIWVTSQTGRHQQTVCFCGVSDLPWMFQNHHLPSNQFSSQKDEHLIKCLEEYLCYKAVYGRDL